MVAEIIKFIAKLLTKRVVNFIVKSMVVFMDLN